MKLGRHERTVVALAVAGLRAASALGWESDNDLLVVLTGTRPEDDDDNFPDWWDEVDNR